jgi:hypothetical protein
MGVRSRRVRQLDFRGPALFPARVASAPEFLIGSPLMALPDCRPVLGPSSPPTAVALAASIAACMRFSVGSDNTGRADGPGAERPAPGTRLRSGRPSSSIGQTPRKVRAGVHSPYKGQHKIDIYTTQSEVLFLVSNPISGYIGCNVIYIIAIAVKFAE